MITVELAMLQIYGDYRQEGRYKISGSNSFAGVGGERKGGLGKMCTCSSFGCS